MATIVLSAVGSALGGPIGLAAGSLLGKEIDNAVFGSGSRDGPRLKELAVTTSSYGQPIQRVFGQMRVAGSVIWATDLIESSSQEGGKGQPSTTVYTYSASFAVALSSTPIARLGRIWADGNLLRGANEDLKVGGALRTYLGYGDQPVDPLIAADRGAQSPAFRDCAYVVFEDLDLADFGNRIPALTFEIIADADRRVTLGQIAPQASGTAPADRIMHALGFSDEGGTVAASLSAIDQVLPLFCVTSGDGFSLSTEPSQSEPVQILSAELAGTTDTDSEERTKQRIEDSQSAPLAVRYYDEQRDYQPSVQRAIGSRPNGRERVIDLPATLSSSGARQLANANAQRARWQRETVQWRVAQLNPAIQPGTIVKLPDTPGSWIVKAWEWLDTGIELSLERAPPAPAAPVASEAGQLVPPDDLPLTPTRLQFLELPSDGTGTADQPRIFAAGSSENGAWRGAALYSEQGSTLVRIGSVGPRRAVFGTLIEDLAPSSSALFEPCAELTVQLVGEDLALQSNDLAGLAAGYNRLSLGSEVLQFANAQELSDGFWRISGLLRGRAGTEEYAMHAHSAGTEIAFVDDRLTALDPARVAAGPGSRIAAIGRGDQSPAYATLRNPGGTLRPLVPVHPKISIDQAQAWRLCWTRRARGQWMWKDYVETPLVEEQESYLVGFGPPASPHRTWAVNLPEIEFSLGDRVELMSLYGAGPLWVRQVGTFDQSNALLLTHFA
ncbi:MAG: phage tail protein [Erythrobacter sp.]|nr:phage tail protein [Erythrobacter sp.]